ncbi:MAG: penicillin acylase family protein [Bryobacterales bacterium]|nr:penicillin acylase family protein [Bryobacterales bacterium]
MNRILRVVNVLILALLVAAAAWAYWYMWRPLPRVSGVLKMPLGGPARIVRDALGVPHITASSVEDALFLEGYAHAQDRLWQMDALRRLAAGELAEIAGPAALESDQESRRLLMRRTAASHYASLPAGERAQFAAYARGVNHFLETHRGDLPVEFTLLGYDPKPWSVLDSMLAAMQMFRGLTTSWKDEILKRRLLSRGDAGKVAFLLPVPAGSEAQFGSNAWAVSGKWTASGKPILANDTHLEWAFPSPWYSVHLKTSALDVAGFSLPGVPCVIIGHNQRIAWGITNLQFDVQDLYLEKFDPQSGQYMFRGRMEQARPVRETIRVKGRAPIELVTWVTRHGPIFVTSGAETFSLHWLAADKDGFQFPFLALNQARNWPEFTQALARISGPGSNFVYADVDGNIGYHAAGKLPVRKTFQGDVPTDGSAGETEWEGTIPFEQLPAAYNPPSGMVVTANQNPFPAAYPFRVNGNFAPPYRAAQIQARLRSRTGWKPGDMLSVEMDLYSAFSHFLSREVYKAWDKRGRANQGLAEPAALLKNWNGQMRRGLAAPLITTLIYQHLRKAVGDRAAPGEGAAYESRMAPLVIEKLLLDRPRDWFDDYDGLLLKCFNSAIEEGRGSYGRDPRKWDYGRYTEFAIRHPVLGGLPYVGRYFRIGPTPMDGSSTTVKQTTRRLGPSMRFIADLSDWERSLHNITIGQSGQPFSSHFRDQWDAYYAGRSFAMEFGNVKAAAVLEIRP